MRVRGLILFNIMDAYKSKSLRESKLAGFASIDLSKSSIFAQRHPFVVWLMPKITKASFSNILCSSNLNWLWEVRPTNIGEGLPWCVLPCEWAQFDIAQKSSAPQTNEWKVWPEHAKLSMLPANTSFLGVLIYSETQTLQHWHIRCGTPLEFDECLWT